MAAKLCGVEESSLRHWTVNLSQIPAPVAIWSSEKYRAASGRRKLLVLKHSTHIFTFCFAFPRPTDRLSQFHRKTGHFAGIYVYSIVILLSIDIQKYFHSFYAKIAITKLKIVSFFKW